MAVQESGTATLEFLHQLARTEGRGRLEEPCLRALSLAVKQLGADRGGVAWWEDGGFQSIVPTGRGPEVRRHPLLRPGLLAAAIDRRGPVVIDDCQGGDLAHQLAKDGGVRAAIAAPIMAEGEVVGALAVTSLGERRFPPDDVELLQLIAAQLAPAIMAARQAAILASLHELAVEVAGLLDPERLAALTVAHAIRLLGAESAGLAVLDRGGDELVAITDSLGRKGRRLPVDKGATGITFQTRQPVQIEDYDAWPERHALPRGRRTRALLAVPLLVGERPIGCLVVRRHRLKEPFTKESATALGMLAAQVAPALEAARLATDQARQARVFQVLHDVAVAAAEMVQPERLIDLTVSCAAELLGVKAVGLAWHDAASGEIVSLGDTDPASGRLNRRRPGEGASGLAFLTGKPQRIGDYRSWSGRLTAADAWPEMPASVLAVPLKVGAEIVGSLTARSPTPDRFSADDEQILALLAAEVGPVLVAAHLREELARAVEQSAVAARRQAVIVDLGRSVVEGIAMTNLAPIAVQAAAAALEADRQVVLLAEPGSPSYRVYFDHWIEGHSQATGGTLSDAVMSSDEPIASEDVRLETRFDGSRITALGVVSILATALRTNDGPVGLIGVGSTVPRKWTAVEMDFLQSVANILGHAASREKVMGELRSANQRLSTVIETVPAILFALDAELRVQFIAGAGTERLPVPIADLIGRDIRALLPPDQNPAFNSQVDAALAGRSVSAALRIAGLDADLELHCRPILDEAGRVNGLIGLAIDVSDRRLAEAARQESEAKSRFLATMSHELRTPLNSILGFSQLLLSGDFGPLLDRQRRYVSNIEGSGRQLLDLINDVLDLSKVAAGQFHVRREPVSVESVVAEVTARMVPQARARGLDVHVVCAEGLVADADRLRLAQVLGNLVSNAIKFTDAGSVTVTAKKASRGVEIAVADTGIGIAEADLERVFLEFIQVDPTHTRRSQGTGLGLALSRRLMELMGGRINAVSTPGQGSTFTLWLPARHERRGPRKQAPELAS